MPPVPVITDNLLTLFTVLVPLALTPALPRKVNIIF